MTRRIDVYFSLLSPFAHLGQAPLLALAEKHGLTIGWKPMPLMNVFAETGGVPLPKRSVQRRRYRDLELMRWAARRGRPVKLRPRYWPFDPSLADCAAIALIEAGQDPSPYITTGFEAAWEQDRDLASADTVEELLDAAGFDVDAVLSAAQTHPVEERYRQNQADAVETGVFGSPAYILDGEIFWGQDRLELLEEMLTSGRARYQPPE